MTQTTKTQAMIFAVVVMAFISCILVISNARKTDTLEMLQRMHSKTLDRVAELRDQNSSLSLQVESAKSELGRLRSEQAQPELVPEPPPAPAKPVHSHEIHLDGKDVMCWTSQVAFVTGVSYLAMGMYESVALQETTGDMWFIADRTPCEVIEQQNGWIKLKLKSGPHSGSIVYTAIEGVRKRIGK